MTPQQAAQEYRSFLEANIKDAPTNSALVVHSSFDFFAFKMRTENCRRDTELVGESGWIESIKSEW